MLITMEFSIFKSVHILVGSRLSGSGTAHATQESNPD